MADKQGRRRTVDSLSGITPPRRSTQSDMRTLGSRHKNYLGIEPLPPEPKKEKTPKVLSVELKLPKIPKLKKPSLPKKRPTKWLPIGLICIIVICGVTIGINQFSKSSPGNSTGEEVLPTTPTFETIVPETAKKTTQQPVSYDPQKRVASFSDKITGVDVTVSQQTLPDAFKANPEEEVEKLAKNFNANKIIYAGEVKAFSGTSSEDGSQTVLFTKKDLLIFIRAKKELDKDGVVQYIINLK